MSPINRIRDVNREMTMVVALLTLAFCYLFVEVSVSHSGKLGICSILVIYGNFQVGKLPSRRQSKDDVELKAVTAVDSLGFPCQITMVLISQEVTFIKICLNLVHSLEPRQSSG